MRAGVALGSNLGDRLANLRAARAEIEKLKSVSSPVLLSAIYETEPIGCETGAGRFLNAVMEVEYLDLPEQFLRELSEIEKTLGRASDHAKNESRAIDLDLLYFDQLKRKTAALELPHPRMMQRRFVLEPLREIRPDLILPTQAEPVSILADRLCDPAAVVRLAAEW